MCFPIVSSIVNFSYNFTCFLCDLLSPLVPNDYSCQDAFSFVSQVKNANLSRTFIISYNVFNHVTNIPLQENIDIAINLIFSHNSNLSITKKSLRNFPICYITDSFIFNSTFYNHINGVAMGSPLAPNLANIFIGLSKSTLLNEYNVNKTEFYSTYVDDI